MSFKGEGANERGDKNRKYSDSLFFLHWLAHVWHQFVLVLHRSLFVYCLSPRFSAERHWNLQQSLGNQENEWMLLRKGWGIERRRVRRTKWWWLMIDNDDDDDDVDGSPTEKLTKCLKIWFPRWNFRLKMSKFVEPWINLETKPLYQVMQQWTAST